MKCAEARRAWLRVVVPRDNVSEPFTAEQLYAAIHAATAPGERTELCLVGRHRDVAIYLSAEARRLDPLRVLLLATYPDAETVPCDSPLRIGGDLALAGARWELAADAAYPVKTVREFANSEPMAMLLAALAESRDGELGVVQFLLQPAKPAARAKAVALAERLERGEGEPDPLWLRPITGFANLTADTLNSLLSPGPTTATVPAHSVLGSPVSLDVAQRVKAILNKSVQPSFAVTLRTAWLAENGLRAETAHAALAAGFGQFAVPGQNALQAVAVRDAPRFWDDLTASQPERRPGILVGTAELAGLCHLPGPDLVVPHLGRAGARRRELRAPLAAEGIPLATTTHRDSAEPVGVTAGQLMTHAYVLGPSGTGKTAMLTRLVLGLAERGVAGVVLDPHGDLVRQVLARLSDETAERVSLLDLTDPGCLPTVNPLWLPDGMDVRERAVARAVRSAAVTAVFADIWRLHRAATPNLLHFLEAAVAALIATGHGCLADLPRFLTDGAFRGQALDQGGDARLRARWSEFAALSADERSRTVRAILNKAAAFDRNPILATVFGDPGPGLRLDEVMDGGRLLLVSLPRGLVPEDTVEIVGSLLVTLLYQAALAREARPPSARPPVVAVIDEFQEFALSSFARIVTATRKYGLGLVVANQNLSRIAALDPDVLSTLLANVATLVAFQPGVEDAGVMAPHFTPFTAADLLAQARYECYWRLPPGSGPTPVVSARTMPPDPVRRGDAAIDELARTLRLPGRPMVVTGEG